MHRLPSLLAIALALLANCPGTFGEEIPRKFQISPAQVERLRQAIAGYGEGYDPDVQMLRDKFKSPGYHTTLKGGYVHSTRSSLYYAVALLDTGDPELAARAEAILNKVISLQDQNPKSKTYGIWSWFLEEPLDKMSPPDWNWADFCGAALLQVALDHRHRLRPETVGRVDEAIKHAARSIRKRNVGPGYTNIAILGSYVTLVAGELYDWAEIKDYARERWRNFYQHTKKLGSFTEYNSPTYTLVALKELGRMLLHVRDAEMRVLAGEIYRMAWEEIALHFHAPTRQWAGPHSRSYSTLLGGTVLGVIQRATEGRVNFGQDEPGLEDARLPLPCPRELERHFLTLPAPHELRKVYSTSTPQVVGTTYLHPAFALGSVNLGDMWNQRRSLVAYWGHAAQPSYLHVRFLRDQYDFAAARFYSRQTQGTVLAAINFSTDGGNTHVSLDRLKQGQVRAKDLRLRFEFGGAAAAASLKAPATLGQSIVVPFETVQVQLAAGYAVFGSNRGRWESGHNANTAWLDVVLFSGPEQELDMNQLEAAAIGFAVTLSSSPKPLQTPTVRVAADRLGLSLYDMTLEVPVKPAAIRDLNAAVSLR